MKKKLASVAVSACLALALTPAVAFAADADYQDTDGHWGEAAIDRWTDYGVVKGVAPGSFGPDLTLSRGEAAQIFANMLHLDGKADLSVYPDVDPNAWYVDAIAACVDAGIMKGTEAGNMEPTAPVNREMFFTMFARTLDIDEAETLEVDFPDANAVSEWARGEVYALANAGYLRGCNGETIDPIMNMNRAMAMALLDQTVSSYVTEDGEATVDGDGIALVLAENAVLSSTGGATVVAYADGATIDLSGMTGKVRVSVMAEDVTLTGAPAGTVVSVGDGLTATVNDVEVGSGVDYVVPGGGNIDDPEESDDPESDNPEFDDPEADDPEADDPEESDNPEAEEEEEAGQVDNGGSGDSDSEEVA